MNNDSPDKDYAKPTHEDSSVEDLLKNICPKFRAGYKSDPTNLSNVFLAVALEYTEYVLRLKALNSVEITRVEEIERFQQLLGDALNPQEFACLGDQMGAFDNIRYQLRIPGHRAGHSDNIRPPKPCYPATLV